MSILDKIFKRNVENKENPVPVETFVSQNNPVQTNVWAQQPPIPETNLTVNVTEPVPAKKYNLEFALTDETMQKRILEYVRPITSDLQIINLQAVYGVRETESGLMMVRSHSSQRKDTESGVTYRTTNFIVLTTEEIFGASYTSTHIHDEGDLTYDVPDGYAEILRQAFDLWRTWKAHREFEQACALANQGFVVSKQNYEICKVLRKELKSYQDEQAKMKAANRAHVEITCEADAKQLFYQCNYSKMKEDYDEETIKAFEEYVSREKLREWVAEECSQILTKIIAGDRENIYEKFSYIDGRCSYWLGAESEKLVPFYTEACRELLASGEERFVVCIHSFLNQVKKGDNPACASELLDLTEAFYKSNYSEEYEKGSMDSHPQKFKQICCEMRGKMREVAVADNPYGFRFVLTNQEDLRSVVLYYRNLYNDDAAVKESVAELNCAYGVENNELFLASLDHTADSMFLQSWDRFSFVGILRATGEVLELRCKREKADGGFGIDSYKGPVKENWLLISEAVEYYRNKPARRAFFDTYQKENGQDISVLSKEAHKGLLTKFKRHYEKEYKIAGSNALCKILIPLINLCEERGAAYGYKNTKFGKPVMAEEIAVWEQENGIILPKDYADFLKFANGGQLLNDRERIFGLQEICVEAEFLEPDYMHVGNMIGDGTMICMSKTTGKVYIEDHGEYDDKGSFTEFLQYFTDFLSGF